jgi:acetyl-CoA C-acetyltransferase
MRDVYVIGIGQTRFGARLARVAEGLVAGARAALDDADVGAPDSIWAASLTSIVTDRQAQLSALLAEMLGLSGVRGSDGGQSECTGSTLLHAACRAIAAGDCETALVVGVERCCALEDAPRQALQAVSLHAEREVAAGVTPATLAGLLAAEAGSHDPDLVAALDAVALKARRNAVHNPYACFREPLTAAELAAREGEAASLRPIDEALWTDGCAAVLLAATPPDDQPAVRIAGTGSAVGPLTLAARPQRLSWDATRKAGARAFAAAGWSREMVDVCELHDAFTLYELLSLDALELSGEPPASRFTLDGRTALEGSLPVNPSGGLLGGGHAPAATGLRQIVSLTRQLRGDAGALQVTSPERALAQDGAGCGAAAVVTLLERTS